uniref:RING-type domain-containing protein n=1 Tax=Dracunculus medinensis TaxID=318479 RepID=A0A0N4UK59_DRAME
LMSQANTISKRNGSGGNRTKRFDRRFNERFSRTKHGDIEMEGFVVECNICCRESDAFGIGDCNHPFCMECVIRLRIIAKINSCPTCRADIDKVKFLYYKFFSFLFKFLLVLFFMVEHPDCERYKLQFTSDYLVRCYNSYLVHICLICEKKDERREFKNFASLNQHVYMVHKFEFCNLCTEHLDLLSRERRIYSRLDMDRHIRSGDPDNSSLRGHPKCLFCDKRFFDEEYRYKHLRKEHFFCQICDNTGCNNFFFESHRNLIDHYKKDHIVCEEGECKKLGIAFETELELKIHKPSIETLEYQVNSVAPPTAFNMQMRDFPRLKVSSNKTEPNQIEKSSKNTTAVSFMAHDI